MNRERLYKLSKRIPQPIRKLIKRFYNPIIPEITKLEYGEDGFPEATELMCNKLKEIIKKEIKGDVIEFGTYKAGATIKLAKTIKELSSDKIIYGLDTFEGLPKETIDKDNIPDFYKGSMDKNDINKVKEVLIKNNLSDKIILMKGLFSESIPKLNDKRFCFAFVDCDLYQGTKEALKFLIPRMNKGGIVFVDDYYSKNWVGVKKAVLELLPEKEIINAKRVYWIKND